MNFIRKKSSRICLRRQFLLLEVLIALTLLSVCFLPIITPHLMLYRSQLELVERIAVDVIAAEKFVDIKADFYRGDDDMIKLLGEIPKRYKNNMKRGKGKLVPKYDESVEVAMCGVKSRYDFSCELFQLHKGDKDKHYLITAKLLFDKVGMKKPVPLVYEYAFVVEKKGGK